MKLIYIFQILRRIDISYLAFYSSNYCKMYYEIFLPLSASYFVMEYYHDLLNTAVEYINSCNNAMQKFVLPNNRYKDNFLHRIASIKESHILKYNFIEKK
jgi:hypothetical protein